MEIVHEDSGVYTLSVAVGEPIMASLQEFAEAESITAAHITGLGAVAEVELGFFNTETREYERQQFVEPLEITNLTGNIGRLDDGTVVVHVHGTFGRVDYTLIGGHVFEAIVSAAGELHVHTLEGVLKRQSDDVTGLNLLYPPD